MGKPRRNPVSDEEIITLYLELSNGSEVAKRTGIGQSTIFRVLNRHKIPLLSAEQVRDNKARFSRDKAAQIRKEYESGSVITELVEAHGGTPHSIKRAIKAAGGTPVPVTPPASKAEIVEIRRLYSEGMSQMKISLALDRSQSMVGRVLRRNGVAPNFRSRENHGNWKGGRYIDPHGYWKVLVESDHAHYSMANRAGYIAEHRLVMASHLGRSLNRHETIHHINGDRRDNRLENLQLRQGKHGKGVVMQCLDCKSHNVAFVKIGDAA